MVDDTVFEIAELRGQAILKDSVRAVSGKLNPANSRIELELSNGCAYAFPVDFVQDLNGASPQQLSNFVIDGQGFNLHWPEIDVDLYVPALINGIFGTEKWMVKELARTAGRKTSPSKAAAARTNGAKGGRPKKPTPMAT